MRLGDFILNNVEPILTEWEAFARSIWPGPETDPAELRDHAEDILLATAHDMATAQTPGEQAEKSRGTTDARERNPGVVAASELHASARLESGVDLMMVVAEYRALRASVIRLWRDSGPDLGKRDLDDVTRFNESIDQSSTEAVRSYTHRVARSRQMFLAILAHDLRNPLSAMKLTGNVLVRSGQLDAKFTNMASQIPVTAAAMGELINDLLDFTGAELTGTLPMNPAPMDLQRLCQQMVNEARAAHPRCTLHYHPGGDLTGEWDAVRLRQVLSNLLGNAVHHGARERRNDCDEAIGTITLSATDAGADVIIDVHNDGIPIPREFLATLFDPLVRGDQADQVPTQRGSMGLGLYITRAIVTAHGGTIGVTSSEESGTTFTVCLPRRRPKDK